MGLLIVMTPVILFIIGCAVFRKSEWRNIRTVIVLWAVYSAFSFGVYTLLSAIYMGNINLMIFSGSVILGTLLIFVTLFLIDKFIIRKTIENSFNKKASDVIYTQGRIVKAVKEGTNFNSVPIVSYYYLVIEYEKDGKKAHCKTKRSYTLSGIAYLLKKYPVVSLEIRDGYTRLPNVPKEEMNAKYDDGILSTIKFDNKDRMEAKKTRRSFAAAPLSILIPAFFISFFLHINGFSLAGLIMTGICSALLTLISAVASKGI